MVPPTGSLLVAVLYRRAHLWALCQVSCHNDLYVYSDLTITASSMLKKHKSERKLRSRSITPKLVALRVILCFSACSWCTPRPMPRSANNHSRLSGILIIYSSHSCWASTLMLQGALFVILLIQSLHSLVPTSGTIVLDMRAGDGNSGEVGSTLSSVSTEKSGRGEKLKSSEWSAIHMVSNLLYQLLVFKLTYKRCDGNTIQETIYEVQGRSMALP